MMLQIQSSQNLRASLWNINNNSVIWRRENRMLGELVHHTRMPYNKLRWVRSDSRASLEYCAKITKHVSNRIGIAHFVMFEDEKNFAFLSCFHKRLGKDCGWIKELHIEIVRFFIFENIACSRMLARPNKYIAQQIGISGRDLENWTMWQLYVIYIMYVTSCGNLQQQQFKFWYE